MSIFKQSKKPRYSSYSALISDHIDKLYSVAFRFTNNKADAEDLVQDLVLKLQPKFKELQSLENPQTWMTKVLYHLFIDNYRRNSRSPITLVSNLEVDQSNIEYFDKIQSETLNPIESAENDDLNTRLNAALKQLSDQDRMMIILYEIEGYSISEIQQVVDIPAGTIKSKLSRARHQLRDLIKMQPTKALNRVNG